MAGTLQQKHDLNRESRLFKGTERLRGGGREVPRRARHPERHRVCNRVRRATGGLGCAGNGGSRARPQVRRQVDEGWRSHLRRKPRTTKSTQPISLSELPALHLIPVLLNHVPPLRGSLTTVLRVASSSRGAVYSVSPSSMTSSYAPAGRNSSRCRRGIRGISKSWSPPRRPGRCVIARGAWAPACS